MIFQGNFKIDKKVCRFTFPGYSCKHYGNCILDRAILNRRQHIDFLATPVPLLSHNPIKVCKKIRTIPNRIQQLSNPRPQHLLNTLETYFDTLDIFQVETIIENLSKSRETPPRPVDKPKTARHRNPQKEKFQERVKIIEGNLDKLYEKFKFFFLSEDNLDAKLDCVPGITDVIYEQLCQFMSKF